MKHENLITREDGTQVKIVAELFTNISQKFSIGTYVLRRESESEQWQYCKEHSEYNTKKMPREEYMRKGRPEIFRYASIGEILKTTQTLKEQVEKEFGVLAQWA